MNKLIKKILDWLKPKSLETQLPWDNDNVDAYNLHVKCHVCDLKYYRDYMRPLCPRCFNRPETALKYTNK